MHAELRVYLDQLRRTLAGVQGEVTSAKGRDDVGMAIRVLNLITAENSYLAAHEREMEMTLAELEEKLAPTFATGELCELDGRLASVTARPHLTAREALTFRLDYFRLAVPDLIVCAEAGDPGAAQVLDRFVAGAFDQLEGVNAYRGENEEMASSAATEGSQGANLPLLTAERMQAYLREIFPDETALEVTAVANVPGGRSKETTMIHLAGGIVLPDRIVMRSDIPGGLVPSRSIDEYAIIALAQRYGVPVPDPIHREPDESRFGGSFILVSAMPGRTEGQYFPEINSRVEDKPEVGRQLARILARLHSIPLAELAGTHIDIAQPIGPLVRETIETTYEQARSFDNPPRVAIDVAYAWLNRHMELAEGDTCLIHCDVGLHNMLIDDGRISAMLDWELACVATPTREIAKILHLIDFLMPREDFFAEYVAAGGSKAALDPRRLQFYAILNYMVTNQRARFANNLFVSGRRPSIVMANAGYDSFYRGSRLLARTVREAGIPGLSPSREHAA